MTTSEPDNTHFEKFIDERFSRVADQISALKELVVQRADAGDKALDVAKAGLNEMRGMASDQAAAFLRRSEYEAKHESIITRLGATEADIKMIIGAGKGGDKIWYVVGVIFSLVIAAVAVFYRTAH